VDGKSPDPRAELENWRRQIGGNPTSRLGRRISDAIIEFDIPEQCLLDFIDAMQMDLDRARYQTFADLREYCYRACSAVMLACIEVLGYESPRAREYAVNLGLGMQLTDMIRYIGQDAALGRIYLPIEDLERFGYAEEQLRARFYNTSFMKLMQFEGDRARYYLDKAAAALPEEDWASLFPIEALRSIYAELLKEVSAIRFNVYRNQIAISRGRQAQIALMAWARSFKPRKLE
jgi:phytoene synthase